MFANTTEAKVASTVAVLAEAGRRYWAPHRYESNHRGITALDYGQAVPVVVTTLEQLQEHGADGEVWRRLGRTGEQTLTAALDNPDGDALCRAQAARADEREAQRPVCRRCGQKFTDDRWEETTARGGAWTAGDLTVCGTCHADDVAREQAARLQAAVPLLEDDREPARPGRGLFRRRG
ncbi:hypothetical protein [Streptomyces sp. NPDC057910]|uniref:hypothetical protein n=1 Tax=Streptomyces sp. NPDC057910 TaxID=3346278 RepID=UPI0036E70D80